MIKATTPLVWRTLSLDTEIGIFHMLDIMNGPQNAYTDYHSSLADLIQHNVMTWQD